MRIYLEGADPPSRKCWLRRIAGPTATGVPFRKPKKSLPSP